MTKGSCYNIQMHPHRRPCFVIPPVKAGGQVYQYNPSRQFRAGDDEITEPVGENRRLPEMFFCASLRKTGLLTPTTGISGLAAMEYDLRTSD